MATQRFTLTSLRPVYVVAKEVKIPEEDVRAQALRWLELTCCKGGEKARLTDSWVATHTKDFKNVDELLIFIRYNMYRDNREVQELADQAVICKELSKRLVEDLPSDLVEESLYAANYRLEEMISRNGMTVDQFCVKRGITKPQLYADVRERTLQSLRGTPPSKRTPSMRVSRLKRRTSTPSSPATTSRTRPANASRSSLRAASPRWRSTRLRPRRSRRSWKTP